jgi:hypothetical protein
MAKNQVIESGLKSVEFKVKTSSGLKVFEWSYNPGDPAMIEAVLKAHGMENNEYGLDTKLGRDSLISDLNVLRNCLNDIFDDPSVSKSIFRYDNQNRDFLEAVFAEIRLGLDEFNEAQEKLKEKAKAEKRAQAKADSAAYRAGKQ